MLNLRRCCKRDGINMSNPPHDPFYSSPFGPFYRRHSPYMVQPEYRIYEMNKRLQSRTEVSLASLHMRQ